MPAALSSARFVTIGKKAGSFLPVRKVCPTESIVFGRLDDLRAQGVKRVQQLQETRLQ